MSSEVHLPNPAGFLTVEAAQGQVVRLQSLQRLMQQGSTVVREATDFIVQSSEGIEALQKEQHGLIESQTLFEEAKKRFALELQTARKDLHEAESKVAQCDLENAQLKKQLEEMQAQALRARNAHTTLAEENAALSRTLENKSAKKEADQKTIVRLETELRAARASLSELGAKHLQAQVHLENAAGLAQQLETLNTQAKSLESQLKAERERRERLMAMVKTSDVSIKPKVASGTPCPHNV